MIEQNKEILPDLEILNKLSFKTSLGKSTNKLKITPDVTKIVEADAHSFETVSTSIQIPNIYNFRIKTPDSIRRKVERHIELRFQSVFNDIVGLRIKVPNYQIEFPEYYRVVDMTRGKANDDGYRAIHLYYKKDNFHYQVEIQLWSEEDWQFNEWTHVYGYKYLSSEVLLKLRDLYDNDEIRTYQEYAERVKMYVQNRNEL